MISSLCRQARDTGEWFAVHDWIEEHPGDPLPVELQLPNKNAPRMVYGGTLFSKPIYITGPPSHPFLTANEIRAANGLPAFDGIAEAENIVRDAILRSFGVPPEIAGNPSAPKPQGIINAPGVRKRKR